MRPRKIHSSFSTNKYIFLTEPCQINQLNFVNDSISYSSSGITFHKNIAIILVNLRKILVLYRTSIDGIFITFIFIEYQIRKKMCIYHTSCLVTQFRFKLKLYYYYLFLLPSLVLCCLCPLLTCIQKTSSN